MGEGNVKRTDTRGHVARREGRRDGAVTVEAEEGLTFRRRRREGGRVGKHARTDIEEVRRSKSTEI